MKIYLLWEKGKKLSASNYYEKLLDLDLVKIVHLIVYKHEKKSPILICKHLIHSFLVSTLRYNWLYI